jgi:hypothetical protein
MRPLAKKSASLPSLADWTRFCAMRCSLLFQPGLRRSAIAKAARASSAEGVASNPVPGELPASGEPLAAQADSGGASR